MMSKKPKSIQDRSIKVGEDATGNVFVTGNDNVLSINVGSESPGEQADRGVPKVFISSTSEDLKPHRAAARDAAIAAGVLPVQMEYFVASGQYAPLEACLEKVAEADVVMLIVAHRFGWVPEDQDGKEHKSITWLECERARADDKEVLAFVVDPQHTWDPQLKEDYRIAAAVSESTATPELLAEVQRNVERLKDFKAWIDDMGVRATFTTPDNLRAKVSESLRDWKQRHAQPRTRPSAKVSRDTSPQKDRRPTFPPPYREWLLRHCADIDLLGVRLKQGQAVKLNHVYVPLMTTAIEIERQTITKRHDRSGEEETLRLEGRAELNLLLEQLDKSSLYVPGDPGTGKSTFCRWVAWLVAAGDMPTAEVAAAEDYVEPYPQGLAERLPLLVRLRDVWRFLPRDAGRDCLSRAELESALGNWLDTGNPGGLDWADVAPHLQNGAALLIFDGVDEVPLREGDGRRAYYPRAALLAGLIEAAVDWQQQGNRLLVTSRPYGIDERQARELPLRHAPIREMDGAAGRSVVQRSRAVDRDLPRREHRHVLRICQRVEDPRRVAAAKRSAPVARRQEGRILPFHVSGFPGRPPFGRRRAGSLV